MGSENLVLGAGNGGWSGTSSNPLSSASTVSRQTATSWLTSWPEQKPQHRVFKGLWSQYCSAVRLSEATRVISIGDDGLRHSCCPNAGTCWKVCCVLEEFQRAADCILSHALVLGCCGDGENESPSGVVEIGAAGYAHVTKNHVPNNLWGATF